VTISDELVICVAEDRPGEEVAVRLLLSSLRRHGCRLPVHLRFPPASAELREWARTLPNVSLTRERLSNGNGWDVKPAAMLALFDEGHRDVLWMDSDILVTAPIERTLAPFSPSALVVCEEARWGQRQGGVHRALSWGLEPGRPLPATVNSGVLRASRSHAPLLRAWQSLLATPEYRAAQGRPIIERPLHLLSDQEVLTALLGASPYDSIRLEWLRQGRDVAQLLGPSGRPKPWSFGASPRWWPNPRRAYDALAHELSPLTAAASTFEEDLDGETEWIRRRTLLGRVLSAAGPADPLRRGVILAGVDAAVRFLLGAAGRRRFTVAAPVGRRSVGTRNGE